jgi:triosephosphate isomerase (TIM)
MDGSEKTFWIVANWKSNKSIAEALEWISIVGPKLEKHNRLKVAVCPTFSALDEVKKAVMVGNFPLLVGSQDISPFETGSFTGEEPAVLLKQFIDISIIGHSERRQNFNESDELISKKVTQANSQNITPLVCVQGEETPIPENCNLIAYEPIFAIGTGTPDTPANANDVSGKIRSKLSRDVEILYGGSVNSDNSKAFLEQDNISGLLIGKASLEAEEFVKIINHCSELL